MSWGKCKLKQQGNIPHLLEYPKSGTLTSHCDEEEGQELSYAAGGKAKWCSHFARQCGDFLQS